MIGKRYRIVLFFMQCKMQFTSLKQYNILFGKLKTRQKTYKNIFIFYLRLPRTNAPLPVRSPISARPFLWPAEPPETSTPRPRGRPADCPTNAPRLLCRRQPLTWPRPWPCLSTSLIPQTTCARQMEPISVQLQVSIKNAQIINYLININMKMCKTKERNEKTWLVELFPSTCTSEFTMNHVELINEGLFWHAKPHIDRGQINRLISNYLRTKQKKIFVGNNTNTFSVLCKLGATYATVSSWPSCVVKNCLIIPAAIGFTAQTKAPVPVGSSVSYNCSADGKKTFFLKTAKC
jgi:hypothetical protein